MVEHGFDGSDLELRQVPDWVIQCVWHGQVSNGSGKEPRKVSFVLEPFDKRSMGLAQLSG